MILVAGSAGFIGFHLAEKRLEMGDSVVGVDNLSDYYDVSLKQGCLKQLAKYQVRCTKYQVRCTKYQVPSTKCNVQCTINLF